LAIGAPYISISNLAIPSIAASSKD